MKAAAKKPGKKAKPRRLIYLTVHKVVIPETGELIGALIPSTKWDSRAMREGKFVNGSEWRGELKCKRNVKFWRLAHVLGYWLADNVEGFEGKPAHEALKSLQEQSGIGCVEEAFTIDMGDLGKYSGVRKVAESLNFEDMDESRFSELWDGGTGEGGWLGWLRREKWGLLSAEQIEDVEMILSKDGNQ